MILYALSKFNIIAPNMFIFKNKLFEIHIF